MPNLSSQGRKDLAKALLPLVEKTPKDRTHQKKLAAAIAQYLAENRQTKELDGLMRDIARLRAERGIVEATATTAFPLSPKLKRELENIVSKTHKADKVVLNEVVDPSVIGGVRLETAASQLDVTIQAELHQLRTSIV